MQALWCCSTCGAVYHKDFPRCPNDGGEVVVSETDPLLGKTVGHYVVDRFIGEGGMGRVYEAHHATLPNKRYAVKVLLGDAGATPSMRKRFAREAESASRLVHPNVVGVTDFGATDGGLPYIVMDFVAGRSLDSIIDEAPMSPARVVRVTRAVCEGLAFAHEAGVVHRDLKPANIIMTGDDVPRIADFGLAQTIDENDVRLTSTGMAMGTPAYAAPEQMAGKRVDHRADLYALGMTMFEMCAGGELPFKGGPMDVATAKAHREAPPFSTVCPGIRIPAGLETLIASLIKRRAAERPTSCAEVIAALDAIKGELAVRVATDATTNPVGSDRVPTPRSRWAMPAVLAGVAAAAAGVWFALARHHAPAKVAEAAPAPAPVEVAPAPVEVAPTPVEVAPTPVEVAPTPVEKQPDPAPVEQPVIEAPAEPPTKVSKVAPPPRHRKHHVERPRPTRVAVAPAVAGSAVAPPPEVPAPPPPAPVVLHAAITGVDVHGSLPAADVRRAIDRTFPAIEQCKATATQAVVAQLTIGESRRAENVHASGGGAASCVGAALAAVRTESAPDVGEVDVTVHVRFSDRQ